MDVVLQILDIAISVLSAFLLIIGVLNLAAFLLQIKSGEEEIHVKMPTFLSLIGIVFLGLAGSISMVSTGLQTLQNAVLVIALIFISAGTYFGLQKHARRYLNQKGHPLKVTYAGTHKLRAKLKDKGIHFH